MQTVPGDAAGWASPPADDNELGGAYGVWRLEHGRKSYPFSYPEIEPVGAQILCTRADADDGARAWRLGLHG